MPIAIACPTCRVSCKITDNAAGSNVKCPKCGSGIDVPNPDDFDMDSALPGAKQLSVQAILCDQDDAPAVVLERGPPTPRKFSMPLTPPEVAFLGPTMFEYAPVKFGPAWKMLRNRGIWYTDIQWLIEAYLIVDPPRLIDIETAEGISSEIIIFGRDTNPIPECPWPDVETARRRDHQIEPKVRAVREIRQKERAE